MYERLGPETDLLSALEAHRNELLTRKVSEHTLAAYWRDLAGVSSFMPGDPTLGQLSELLPEAFAQWASSRSASSVLRCRSAWSVFCRFLVDEGALGGNPVDRLPKPRRPKEPVRNLRSSDYVTRLLQTASIVDPRAQQSWPERDVAMVATFLITGIRLSELIDLENASLYGPPEGAVLAVIGKGRKAREVPVPESLRTTVRAYQETRTARFVGRRHDDPRSALFVHYDGTKLTRRRVQYVIERIYSRAGIRGSVPQGALVHALRHTFATDALRGGASVLEAQRLLGHASLNTTQRYLEATGDELRQAVNAHPSKAGLELFLKEEGASP
jgi:site-specific recombinase XerD